MAYSYSEDNVMSLYCLVRNPSGILRAVATGDSRKMVFVGIGSCHLEIGWTGFLRELPGGRKAWYSPKIC